MIGDAGHLRGKEGAPWKGFTAVPCRCGGNICDFSYLLDRPKKRRFKCKGCRRWMPWCLSAADNMPDHCDFCWKEES